MSIIVFDYKCPSPSCGKLEHDKFVKRSEMDSQHCPDCGTLMAKLLPAPRVDWDSLAMGNNASPEAIRHWEKKRKVRQAKEAKSKREHGDYGKLSGS